MRSTTPKDFAQLKIRSMVKSVRSSEALRRTVSVISATPVIRWKPSNITQSGHNFRILRCAVLASSVLLMLPGAWAHSVTVVEVAHLPAGLAALQRGSLAIYRVCGPLSRILYSLPAHLAGVRVDYPVSFDSEPRTRLEWQVGLVFQKQNRRAYHDIYRWSRLVPILVAVLGGCLVSRWSTDLFGPWPGVLSLCVWCSMPPIPWRAEIMRGTVDVPDTFSMRLPDFLRMTSSDAKLSDHRCKITIIRAVILLSSVLLMLPGAWGNSATVVEFAHLPAGLAAWQRHSLGIYRVCGPLSKFLYALPAYVVGVRVNYPESFDSEVVARREWELGRIFQDKNKGRYHCIYRWSRLLPIIITVLGGCLVCDWSTRLFGAWPGIVSLCAWSWMPPMLGHGSLVTSDMLSAVVLLLAARSFWTFLIHPSGVTAILSGITLGLAQATKFTLLVLYPCWVLLLIGRVLQLRVSNSSERGASPSRVAGLAAMMLIISVVVLDSLYLFQDVGFHLTELQSTQSHFARNLLRLGDCEATSWLLQVPLPIPLEFVRGLDSQLIDSERLQSAYLLGWTRRGGWWYWYLVASLIKIPLPIAGIFGLAVIRLPTAVRDGDRSLWAGLCVLVTAAEVAIVISATTGTGSNAAFRYLIPSIALLCVWIGRAWSAGCQEIRVSVIALIFWLATNAVVSIPDHLGWQNELGWAWSTWTGRPALIGDSLDWGQDLARLSDWVSRNSREGSTRICVYGLGDLEPYSRSVPADVPAATVSEAATYLAISSNILLGYESRYSVFVRGERCSFNESDRATLSQLQPFDYVGRTIRVYRVTKTRLHGGPTSVPLQLQ